MAKFERGLQKKISAIFEGVPVPKDDDVEQSPQMQPPPPSEQLSTGPKRESPASTSVKPFIMEQLLSSSLAGKNEQPAKEEAPPKKPYIKVADWRSWWKQIENKLFVPKPGVDVGRQKKMAILMTVLFVVFIFVIIRILKQSSPPAVAQAKAQNQNTQTATAIGSASSSEDGIDWKRPELYPATLRDPMKPGLSAGGHGGGLIVKGIVYSEDKPSAVIDSQIVHQGEKIGGVTVVKINKNNVEFEVDGKTWTQEVQQ